MAKVQRIMQILETETNGTSYNAHRYSLDAVDRASLDYDEKERNIEWLKTGETSPQKTYVDLRTTSARLIKNPGQIFSYFLDGSRKVFKVDDMAYELSPTRKGVYPVVAGQIGVGCCHRVNRQMEKEKYINELVISLPKIADANGKQGFFPAMVQKINDRGVLSHFDLKIDAILPYDVSKDDGPATTETIDNNIAETVDKNTAWRVDKLSQYNKQERKLISRIFGIIVSVTDKEFYGCQKLLSFIECNTKTIKQKIGGLPSQNYPRKDRQIAEDIIRNNHFSALDETSLPDEVKTVLQYYKIRR